MYDIASEWKQIINVSRKAILDNNGKALPMQPIEPDVVLTHNTIAFILTSESANPNWYKAGYLYQAFFVPFGTAGAAQGEQIKVVLNRYTIHRFTTFPSVNENKYLLSYSPERYYKDVRLQVWEYIGTNQGATLDSLETLVKTDLQRSASIQALLNKLSKKR
ncbi:hypothetical protein [Nostoc sp. PA-18-2419]|uniref:hypothetical protein n=1 Tax=Nostoc sp. PA-18-2419 TaxID=2575443 RepID=UPI00110829B9|nr:hypothetical protein [Nostoc sp. PA-18-2419]